MPHISTCAAQFESYEIRDDLIVVNDLSCPPPATLDVVTASRNTPFYSNPKLLLEMLPDSPDGPAPRPPSLASRSPAFSCIRFRCILFSRIPVQRILPQHDWTRPSRPPPVLNTPAALRNVLGESVTVPWPRTSPPPHPRSPPRSPPRPTRRHRARGTPRRTPRRAPPTAPPTPSTSRSTSTPTCTAPPPAPASTGPMIRPVGPATHPLVSTSSCSAPTVSSTSLRIPPGPVPLTHPSLVAFSAPCFLPSLCSQRRLPTSTLVQPCRPVRSPSQLPAPRAQPSAIRICQHPLSARAFSFCVQFLPSR